MSQTKEIQGKGKQSGNIEKSKTPFFRVFAYDVIRSWSIYCVIALHCAVFDFDNVERQKSFPESGKPPSVMRQVLFFFLTSGGMFNIISNSLYSYMIILRVRAKKNSRFQMFLSNFVMGICFLVIQYLIILFSSQRSGILYLTLHPTKSVLTSWSDMQHALIHNGNSIGIALTKLIMSFFLYFVVFTKKGIKRENLNRNLAILMTSATLILLITPWIRNSLYAIPHELLEEDRLFMSILFSFLVGDNFPIFPYIAYAMIGAAIGMCLANGYKLRQYIKVFVSYGVVFGVIGFTYIFSRYNALHTGLYLELSTRGMYFRTFLHYSHMWFLMSFFVLLIFIFDLRGKKESRKKVAATLMSYVRIHKIGMTIYVLEGMLKACLHYPFDLLWPTWNTKLWSVLTFGVFNCFVWFFIAKFWEKIGYFGSIEWTFDKIVYLLTRKRSKRYDSMEKWDF